jgi:hypothetical protein
MSIFTEVSRRVMLRALAIFPILSSTIAHAGKSSRDADLVAFGEEFDFVAAQMDRAISTRSNFDPDVFERFDEVENKIMRAQATTLEGLSVKARVICWGLLGDLDPANEGTMKGKLAISIVRNLIRLNAPDLEKPGALQRLVQECTT